MERWLSRYSEQIYCVMRLVAGAAFSCHGAQKLFGAFGAQAVVGNPMMLAAGIVEFFGGLLIAIGLGTGYAAFLASGEMAVAYFKAHASNGLLPILNKGELAVIYCFVFLYVASRGSGAWSLDRALRRS